MAEEFLRMKGISKSYPGVKALDNVSLTIPHGMYGLLGPNGAGKSTLMRTLATLQEPDSGSAMLGTIDVLIHLEPHLNDTNVFVVSIPMRESRSRGR